MTKIKAGSTKAAKSPLKAGEGIPTVENILKVYRSASPEVIAAGMTWYADAHTLAVELDTDTIRSSGVIASLSPQQSWERNVILAVRAYAEGFASGTLPDACAKADRIMSGELPLDVLGGKKVRSFFDNILNPTGDSVTIDRHAHDIAINRVMGSDPRRVLERVGGYELFADCYREAAKILGILPLQLQAVTWVAWRLAKGLK